MQVYVQSDYIIDLYEKIKTIPYAKKFLARYEQKNTQQTEQYIYIKDNTIIY